MREYFTLSQNNRKRIPSDISWISHKNIKENLLDSDMWYRDKDISSCRATTISTQIFLFIFRTFFMHRDK